MAEFDYKKWFKDEYYPPHGNRKKRIIQPCGYKYCPNCGAKMDEEV